MAAVAFERPALARLHAIARRPMSYRRRLAVALAGALVGGWLIRPWLSLQLAVAGNDALGTDAAYARHLYDRALWLDPRDRFAAEGWMIATAELRRRGSDALAIRFAGGYLAVDPDALEVRRLRGIAELHAGRTADAARDLLAVARRRNVPGAWAFALSAARRTHDAALRRAAAAGLRALAPRDPLLRRAS